MKYRLLPIKARCPLCGFDEGLLLYEVESEKVSQFFAPADLKKEDNLKINREIESLWPEKRCKIIRCKKCSLCYAFPFKAGTSNFYSILYSNLQYSAWKKEYDLSLKEIKKIAEKNQDLKYLEIGAGNGNFAEAVSSYIKKKNILCLEYSDHSCKEINNKGIKCRGCGLLELDSSKKYDIICLFQVLEHLDNLDKFFKKIMDISEKNAEVIITVPDESNISFCEQRLGFMDYPPNHISRWNLKSFNFVSKKFGFKIIGYKKFRNSYFSLLRDVAFGRYTMDNSDEKKMANKVSLIKLKNPKSGKILKGFMLVYYLVTSLFLMPKNKIYSFQWVHLRKV